jgi:hypothetical protein
MVKHSKRVKEMECESVVWIQVAQDRVHWHVLVNTNDVLNAVQGRKFVIN